MNRLRKSEFLNHLYMAGLAFNTDRGKSPDKDDEYRISMIIEGRGMQPPRHRWIEGKGYTKPCPIAKAIMFFASSQRDSSPTSVKVATAQAAILQELNEAAWEEYEALLAKFLAPIAA